jgi:hypothetical protein
MASGYKRVSNSFFARIDSAHAIQDVLKKIADRKRVALRRPSLERVTTPDAQLLRPNTGNEDSISLTHETMPAYDDSTTNAQGSLQSRLEDLTAQARRLTTLLDMVKSLNIEGDIALERTLLNFTVTRLEIQMQELTAHAKQPLREANKRPDALRPEDSTVLKRPTRVPQRSTSECYSSLRRPLQFFRHIVLPRRNSRGHRQDVYPSDDSARPLHPRPNAAGVSTLIDEMNAGCLDDDDVSCRSSAEDIVYYPARSKPSLGPYTPLASHTSVQSHLTQSSTEIPAINSVMDARCNTWLATQPAALPRSASSATGNDNFWSVESSGSSPDILERAREYNHERQSQNEAPSIHSSTASLPERCLDESMNESEVWASASEGSASVSGESGMPESLI